MALVTLYTIDGSTKGELTLDDSLFGVPVNAALVHEAVVAQTANSRVAVAHTKTRADVAGTGKKPWKQKGTGRARHGSSRSPIWVGGGVTHGPLAEKKYKRKISKKMRAQALFSVLSKKWKDGEILFVDSFSLSGIKTKKVLEVIKNLSKVSGFKPIATSKKAKVLTAFWGRNEKTEKSFRNLPQLEIVFLKNLNPLDVLNYKYLFIENPEESVKFLEMRG